jgi:acyl-CoA hydrolase
MTEAPNLRTLAAPPYRDYLTEGVTRFEALAMCEEVADETPEMAQRYLRWLVDEVRASGWGDGAPPVAE